MKNYTPLMWIYLCFAIAGLFIPWYFNIMHMQTGLPFTPKTWLEAGMVSPLASSVTLDFIIGSTAVLIWMIIEARRLKMKYLWFYILFTFLIAWAFTTPLFLFNRERVLRKASV